ncbi:zinc finger homeobox protein 4 [Gouania willdenowi]|uniref:zinc finger homeobox protein 4 n=1 Tax=Gouania willdenowi TaxID=441366 RepID=UPI0010555BE8|nr:zinc finger homeobox protein 4-like [Gouania willdenowi]
MQEECGETVCSERNGEAEWLCPLCQKGLSERSSLSRHLTEQHNVLPSCVDRLLDIAVLRQAASRAEAEKAASKSSESESFQVKPSEDISSDPSQSTECTDASQMSQKKEIKEERIMEQEGGETETEPEEEGTPEGEAKQPPSTENAETMNEGEKSVCKEAAPEKSSRFKCNACLESFPSRTALSVHYNSASHIQRMTTGSVKQTVESSPLNSMLPVLPRPYISTKPYQCAVCRVSYNHAITLESHMKSVLHQTRSRNAGIAANGMAATAGLKGSFTSVPNMVVTTSASGTSPFVPTTSNCAAPGTLVVTTGTEGDQHPSILPSPVASAQAVSAFLTLLTSSHSTLSPSLLPSLFSTAATPSAAAAQLVPQPQMVMPLILNGLQAQTQQQQDNQPGQLLTQCVPFVGLSAAQQALLVQRLNSLKSQWPSAGLLTTAQPCQEEQKQAANSETDQGMREGDEAVNRVMNDIEDQNDQSTDNITAEKSENDEDTAHCSEKESKGKFKMSEVDGKLHVDSTIDGDSGSNQIDPESDKAPCRNLSPVGNRKSICNNISPSTSVPSNSSFSPINLNLTLSPDTPQKSQAGTSPSHSLGTPKLSPSTNALIKNKTHPNCNMSVDPELPELTEFQSEVLWAFFESRTEADAASPPSDDCEALGKEVGLSVDEVRRWLSQARFAKRRQKQEVLEHNQCLDMDYDDEESSLVIAEGDDDDEALGNQAIDLSSTRGKRKRRKMGRGNQSDFFLTSDSENEVYTSVIVSDVESQNGSHKEEPESPVKEVAQQEIHGEKGPSGGKVLRSTTVFLSDAEDEYEEEEGGGGQRAKRKKVRGEFDRDEVEFKKERQDPDVDLELEAQGDPPSSLSHIMDHGEIQAGALHSLPLTLTPFSTQFLSPYILSLAPSIMGNDGKIPLFSNPPTITRFPSSLLSPPLSSHNQFSHYLTNGDDCEGALDLSMGKNSKSASSSSSLAEKISVQKGQLLDGLGLKPTSKSLVVVQVKPESITGLHPPNSSMGLINCNNMTKSNIYMSAAEKSTTILKKEHEKEQHSRKAKGKRYRDMRRSRTIIQAEQLDILYGCYFKDPNPGKHEFEQIAEWVHLPKKVVQIWFQNMRARERKGEVRFISDGTLAAVGKPLIKFTWPLTKPIFSHKPSTNNAGGTAAPLMVRTLLKTEMETVKESSKPTMVKKLTPIPIKPKEVVSLTTSLVPKTNAETTTSIPMVKILPKVNTPVHLGSPKDPIPIAPRSTEKLNLEEGSEDEKTDEEKDNEDEQVPCPGSLNRMVPKLPTTPITNRPPATPVMPQKQNGMNYWSSKVPIKINTLSREQLALPKHTPGNRTIPPPPTPSIAPVSPNTPSSAKAANPNTPSAKASPSDVNLASYSSRRPRTHLSCLQLFILQSCYETCAHPNAMECEAIGSELNLPLKVVQIWFQNTRAKEKRWRLQQEKVSLLSGGKVDTSSGTYLQYSALKANRPILPKPVQLTISEAPASPASSQTATKETLVGRCDACSVTFESRAAARAHIFSPRHLATLRTTNFGQPIPLVSKNGSSAGGEVVVEVHPPTTTSSS